MFNESLLLRSTEPYTHILIPIYHSGFPSGSYGWHSLVSGGSFIPSTIKNVGVYSFMSSESGSLTSISFQNLVQPFDTITVTRLDTNEVISLYREGQNYLTRTKFFYSQDSGKEIYLKIEAK